LVAVGAGAAVAIFLALAAWESFARDQRSLSVEEIARQNPEFYAWYNALPVATLDDGGRHRTTSGASVAIVEFSDFECPYCARAHRDLKRVLPRFGSDVQVVFRHFPLDKSCNHLVAGSKHRYACLAATASECAAQQGRFWEYQDTLFANQSALDRDSLVKYAGRLGLDHARFRACLDSDAPRAAVRNDIAAAEKLGVSSTPTFYLNGRALPGALDADKLEYAIRLERAARRAQP
jgi:protein-disulfide isomerase